MFPDPNKNESLLIEYQHGSIGFDILLSQFKPMIIKFGSSYIPGFETEDLQQELIIKLYQISKAYRSNGVAKFSTYLYKGLSNHVLKLQREQMALIRSINNTVVSLEQLLEDHGWDIEDDSSDLNDSEIILAADLEGIEKKVVIRIMSGSNKTDVRKEVGISNYEFRKLLDRLKIKLEPVLKK